MSYTGIRRSAVNSFAMSNFGPTQLREEAQNCRRIASAYEGRPESSFLFSAAKAFDELADVGRWFKTPGGGRGGNRTP